MAVILIILIVILTYQLFVQIHSKLTVLVLEALLCE